MIPAAATLVAETDHGWHYAAWVAVDMRLLVFVLLIAGLTAAGVSAIVVRSRRVRDHLATFIVAFAISLVVVLLIFNEIAYHPVFVVEAFFPFP